MHPLLLGPLLLALCAAPPPARAVPALPIAFAGDPVPGAPGEVFSSGLFGQVNDAGEVAISGRYASAFQQGIFRWDAAAGGTPTPIVLPGDPAPDAPAGTEFASGFVQEMTGSGTFGYSATFATGPGGVTESTNRALYRFGPSAGHELLARDGDMLPGTSGRLVLDATPDIFPSFNAAGEAVFSGLTITPPLEIGFGFWKADTAGAISPIAVDGAPAPGGSGLFYAGIPVFSDVNEAGGVAFSTALATTPTATSGAAALFGPDGAGGVTEIARVGGFAPDVPGAVFIDFQAGGEFQQNDLGEVAFVANLLAGLGGVTLSDDQGIWLSKGPGDLTLELREGEAPPGLPSTALNDFETPWLNDAGDLALGARLKSGIGGVTLLDDTVLLGPDGAGGLIVRAREGDPIPALPGDQWGDLLFPATPLNEDGDVFVAVTTRNGRRALFLVGADGAIDLIVATGSEIDLGGGDVRTVTSFIDWNASDDLTRYAVTANFSDGTSGLFLLTIPEPGTGALLALGTLTLAGARRAGTRSEP